MKLIKYLPLVLAFAAASCEDSVGPKITENKVPAAFDKSFEGKEYTFVEEHAGEVAETFTWKAADFGYQAAVKYSIEAALDDKFEKVIAIAQSNLPQVAITVGALNEKLFLGLKLKEGVQSKIYLRIKSVISSVVDITYSEPISVNVTPYFVERKIGVMWVPGDNNGWKHTDNDRVYSMEDNGKFENYFYFPANAKFLFTPADNWNNKFGGSNGALKEGGSDIAVGNDTPGMYLVNANTVDLVYSLLRTDWGIIGSAVGGWGDKDDVMFSWDSQKMALVAEANFTSGEEFKFRANHDWKYNFGAGEEEGFLAFDKANMRFTQPSGKYRVTFYIMALDKYYTLEKI